MKKKLLTGTLLLSSMALLSGCHMSHDWQEATCTTPKTCLTGGETEGEALGHTWVEATCTEPKTCSICGETEGEALGHTLTEANYQQPAICTVCGETEGEALQADLANVPLNLVELNDTFDYIRPCAVDPSENTVMESVFKDYSCFVSDDTHEAVDGYVWQTVTFEMKMNDYNGWQYGAKGVRYGTTSYYDIAGFDDSYNDNESTFTVNFDGVDYSDCMENLTSAWSGWDADNWNDNYPPCNTYTLYYECRVPEGYDGIVICFVGDSISDFAELLEADKQEDIEYTLRLPAAIPE